MTNRSTAIAQNNLQDVNIPAQEISALVADLQRQCGAVKEPGAAKERRAVKEPQTLKIRVTTRKGPASQAAKDRVKYNALRHGFTGQVLIMTPAEREKFDAFVQGMMTDLAPIGTHETFLANSMAEEAWRLNQIRARCSNLSAIGDFDGAGDKYRLLEGAGSEAAGLETAVVDSVVARDQSKQLALMSLYGQRTQRAYEKYKKELNELQEKRKANKAVEMEEARLLFQLADTQGVAWDPKKDGFVFSLPLIRAQTERHHRLILAKRTEAEYRRKNNLTEITRAAGKAA